MSTPTDAPPGAGPAATAAPPGRRRPGPSPRVRGIVLPLVSLLVFLVLWQLAAASGAWNETFVPYPATSGRRSSTSRAPTTAPAATRATCSGSTST